MLTSRMSMAAEINEAPSPSWRGLWVLSKLSTRAGRQSRGFRTTRLGGWMVGLGATASIALLAVNGAADTTDVLALRVLAYASWLYGVFALSALCKSAPTALDGALGGLAAERGYSPADVSRSWVIGAAAALARGVSTMTLIPLVVSIALSDTTRQLTTRLLLLPAVVVYALVFGYTLALVTHWARRLTPAYPRVTTAIIVLVPYGAHLLFPDTPSIPSAFGSLIDAMITWGGWGL